MQRNTSWTRKLDEININKIIGEIQINNPENDQTSDTLNAELQNQKNLPSSPRLAKPPNRLSKSPYR